VNDLTRRRDKNIVMQKSEHISKVCEGNSKKFPRLKIIKQTQVLSQQVTDTDDPAELRQTAAYRFAYATRITNDAWIINLRATLA